MKFVVTDHAYTRAWSRVLFRFGSNIKNRHQLQNNFEQAFLNEQFFLIAKGPKSYKCSDRQLTYVFAIQKRTASLITVYPKKGK